MNEIDRISALTPEQHKKFSAAIHRELDIPYFDGDPNKPGVHRETKPIPGEIFEKAMTEALA